MGGSWRGTGSAPPLFLAGEAALLRADEQVFEAMLEGWSDSSARVASAPKPSTAAC